MDSNNTYIGRGWSFPPEFNGNSLGVNMLTGTQGIEAALYTLLTTEVSEREMRSEFGIELRQYLFQEINGDTANRIIAIVARAIERWEPRVLLDDIQILEGIEQEGTILISIDYIIRNTNKRNNLVFPFYINEGTHLPIDI